MKKNRFFLFALLFGALAFSFAACEKEDGDDDVDPSKGIIGEWQSSGDNVALLLQGEPFFTDSIYAKMNDDGSYRVESYSNEGVMTLFTGTFTQEESGTGEIWTITLQQGVPYSGTSEGIFEIYWDEDPINMKYEVLQTEPALGLTPPTPEGGFGSTAGGILGQTNVQVFVRID
ncbi:MAG: hypothetical protein V2I46_07870 [Bacteroides sp.]|jgi:hypothetical protein|nr:hypothetical protein [Bacteroides sp.]